MSMSFGDYIKEQRIALGYTTQASFAEYAGINSAHLNQIERGKIALPNAELRRKLAKALGVSHIEILVRAGELEVDEAAGTQPDPSPAERAIMREVRAHAWTPAQVRAAVGSLRAIAQMGRDDQA